MVTGVSRSLAASLSLFLSLPAVAAVDLTQAENPHDRSFERLPDLNLVRGAKMKVITLNVAADADEAWTIAADESWAQLSANSGTGPGTVTLTFDYAAFDGVDDPSATLVLTGPDMATPGDNLATLGVNVDIWPKTYTGGDDRGALREFVKNPDNWPTDGSYPRQWELWGFLPDETTHPESGSGRNMEAWETVPCADGESGDNCTREGQAGLAAGQAADQAWLLSVGDPRVSIAVLDSGIKWSERTLLTKHYLNAEELRSCPPEGADATAVDVMAEFDVNGDGVFNIRDYDDSTWMEDLNANGLRDPQDLIHGNNGAGACSDGVDTDGNGYTDDISGWDFYWNDNDPSDDSDYGHGTGEARDSAAEGHDFDGDIGICARCKILNVRVGDSFIVDVNQFADGVIFAADSGAKVVQEALGSLNNTPYAQAAIDYAYDKGTAIIASAADEASYHHNYPGSLEHTLYVHAIVADTDGDFADASTFLNFGNCTNWGGKLALSTPGTGCSSEATGKTSGQAGLTYAYFEQLRDASVGTDLEDYYREDLSAEELYQVLSQTADDIDIPGSETDEAALARKQYPSNEGWDLQFGYGRNNSRTGLEALRDQRIPPEVDIEFPRWYEVFDPARVDSFEVKARIDSPRLDNLRWTLKVGIGNPPTAFVEVATGTGTTSYDDVLATIDLSESGPLGDLVKGAPAPAVHPEQFAATLELTVIGEGPNGDVTGNFRKVIAVREDGDVAEGFPLYLGASGEASPKVTDLDGDGIDEIVVATADGLIHAFRSNGTELEGFPTRTPIYAPLSDEVCSTEPAKCFRGAAAYSSGWIADRMEFLSGGRDIYSSIVSTIAVGDLDGDGAPGRELVVATMDGLVAAYNNDGTMMDGFPVGMDEQFVSEFEKALTCTLDGIEVLGCRTDQRHAEMGFFSTPTLVDFDGDGDLEITVGGGDQRAYAWHHDGSTVNGWPVHLQHSAVPAFDEVGGTLRYDGRIITTAVVADVFGDGTPVVFYGSNERVENDSAGFLYGIWPDGEAHSGGPYLDGFPVALTGFIPDEILPYVGRGNPNSAAAGDVDNDGRDEVINAGLGGDMTVIHIEEDGSITMNFMESTRGAYGPESNVDELASLPVINNPSVADLDGDGRLDIINGTAGTGLIQIANDGGLRAEFDHSVSAWVADNGLFLDGFPHRVWDYQFFMNYAVADIDGDGSWNVLSGDGGYFVYAPEYTGEEAPGFPKFTSQWHIATPAVGDIDGDERMEVVANTREGWLWVWKTEGHVGGLPSTTIPAIQWAGYAHDDHNTSNVGTPLPERPRMAGPVDAAVCGCNAAAGDGESSEPLGGAIALFVLLGTLGVRRRRR
jgi:MYXO-CTERM domain-containing protein